eukprot:586857-Prorocentrum_minimum.AAC.1
MTCYHYFKHACYHLLRYLSSLIITIEALHGSRRLSAQVAASRARCTNTTSDVRDVRYANATRGSREDRADAARPFRSR